MGIDPCLLREKQQRHDHFLIAKNVSLGVSIQEADHNWGDEGTTGSWMRFPKLGVSRKD